MTKPKWCRLSEKPIKSFRLLDSLKEYWQHKLGLCRFGIEVTLTHEPYFGRLDRGLNENHWLITANNERVLLHELLELLLIKSNVEPNNHDIIFPLTNALLRLKYTRGNIVEARTKNYRME